VPRRQVLRLHPGRFAVCRLEPGGEWPSWVREGDFVSVTCTRDELSVVAPEENVPPGDPSNGGWRLLEVEGPLAFTEVGILASLAAPLAAAGVSLFAISTHDTDYLLVQEGGVPEAVAALRGAGHEVRLEDE
jgi:hypothetical protein